MGDLLVDSDVCIDHLSGRSRLPGRRSRLAVSVITRAELLAGAEGRNVRDFRRVPGLRLRPGK
jgi:predicted nucleic acid-binding protein